MVINQNQKKNVLSFVLYDKTGQKFDEFYYNFNFRNSFESIIGFLDWMNDNYPLVYIAGKEVSPNVYDIKTGYTKNIKLNDLYTSFDLDESGLKPLCQLKVIQTEDFYTQVKWLSNFTFMEDKNMQNKYLVKSDLLTKKYLTKLKRILGY